MIHPGHYQMLDKVPADYIRTNRAKEPDCPQFAVKAEPLDTMIIARVPSLIIVHPLENCFTGSGPTVRNRYPEYFYDSSAAQTRVFPHFYHQSLGFRWLISLLAQTGSMLPPRSPRPAGPRLLTMFRTTFYLCATGSV